LNIFLKIFKWVAILCLPILLLSSSLAWGFNSLWLYEYGFDKYNVSESSGLSPADLNKSARGLIDYFNSSDEYIQITLIQDNKPFELFTPDEKIHFKDVKQLVWLDYKILIVTLALILIYSSILIIWRKGALRRQLAKYFVWSSGLSLLTILILVILSLFDFENLFLQFHYLAFTNQYWSAEGYMLLLFPGGFWFDAAIFCISFMALLSILILGISILYLRVSKK
jgi:integral membrane protein (TIGR01906 family)